MNSKLIDYFHQLDNGSSKKEVDCSLKEAKLLYTRIDALKRDFIREAFQGEKLVFKYDEDFFQSRTSFGFLHYTKMSGKSKLRY